MKRSTGHAWFTLVALCGAFMLAGGISSCSPSAGGGPGEEWTEDLDEALERARRTNRPLLLNFTGSDWCGWCIRLHKEVFGTDDFKSYAAENLVLVTIDFPHERSLSAEIKQRNEKLKNTYGVQGFPTIVILDSSGEELGRTGYLRGGPSPFIAKVKQIIGK